MEDELSVVFHEAVDLAAYPTYEEKVDEPMDFGTIKGKLDNWEYRRNDPLGFQRDVRLVRDGGKGRESLCFAFFFALPRGLEWGEAGWVGVG